MFNNFRRILTPLLLIILLTSTIAFGSNIPLGPYFDDIYFDLSDSALILKIVPHEKGGLEADVSAYDGLIKITGGATSNLTIGIADDNILEMDDADAEANDYCKLTANGIVGRSYAEVKTDLSLVIGTNVQAFDNALASISGLAYVSPSFIKLTANDTYAVRTLAEVKTDLAYTDAEIKAILVDEVTKTGDFTAGRIAKINNATGIIEQGTNTDADVADAVTKKHTSGSETQGGDISGTVGNASVNKIKRGLDASKSATPAVGDIYLATDTDKLYKCITAEAWTLLKNLDLSGNNVTDLADITSPGADIEDAVTKKHTQNTDTQFDFYNALADDHTWSGDKDTQPVGESVDFGDLLYFNWTDKEWKKTDADAAATMPGERIALESKTDGQTCLMLVKGYIRDDSAFEFTASMVYASCTPGAMSSTAPTETGDQIQRVGTAKSADILFFNPSIDVGEI